MFSPLDFILKIWTLNQNKKNGSSPRGAANNMTLHKIQKSAKSTHPTIQQCTQDTM